MSDYVAPVKDILFTLQDIAGLPEIAALPGYQDASPDTVAAVLEEAAKFAGGVLAPLNYSGDQQGSRAENGKVRTPDGFPEAYSQFGEAGWNSVAFDPEFGGQGMPWALTTALQEMWNAANMSFALCPLLTQGAIEALQVHGSARQKAAYLANMIAGKWTGTMNLTEPQAGSDLGAIKTKATPDGDRYRIKGQKIFITYGEHDLAENIIHLVLARLPDAPKGSKGISLFIVPKYLIKPDGSLGAHNDLRCVSIEHKLGIHASPTCVMAYGDGEGALGDLVGEPHAGLEYMFTMMNNARLAVGVQGLAIADRAYQQAVGYANGRVQSAVIGAPAGTSLPILHHPDVRRNLMTMRALTEAMRSIAYFTAGALDRAKRDPDPAARKRHQALTDLLIPVAKAWCTDQGERVASIGVQIHGGMGFIEETGAAQYYRDARIASIYEGTNGIQAIDLLGRKLLRDGGQAMHGLQTAMAASLEDISTFSSEDLRAMKERLSPNLHLLTTAVDHLLIEGKRDMKSALAVATPFLGLVGTVLGGWLLMRGAMAAARRIGEDTGDRDFAEAKIITARFYADNVLPGAASLAAQVASGAASTLALAPEHF